MSTMVELSPEQRRRQRRKNIALAVSLVLAAGVILSRALLGWIFAREFTREVLESDAGPSEASSVLEAGRE